MYVIIYSLAKIILSQYPQEVISIIFYMHLRIWKHDYIESKLNDYLDIPSTDHDAIHLFQGKLRRLRHFVFNKGKTFVLLGYGIPRHVNTLDGAKGQECLSDGVFFQLKADASHIYSTKYSKKI